MRRRGISLFLISVPRDGDFLTRKLKPIPFSAVEDMTVQGKTVHVCEVAYGSRNLFSSIFIFHELGTCRSITVLTL